MEMLDRSSAFVALIVLWLACALAGCAATRAESSATAGASTSAQQSAHTEEGLASWYGPELAKGTPTASGERYRDSDYTAAHLKLRFGTRVLVENLRNHKRVVVRINDRGPYRRGRIIDVSGAAARALGMVEAGVVPVRLIVVP